MSAHPCSRPIPSALLLALALGGLAGFSSATQGGAPWVGFVRDDARLVAAPEQGLNDTEEKDYAWGDLDGDGWVDLVVARKQPWSTIGRRANVLFMNEGGVLVDRTAQFASASTVPGDQGFLTPTNDRDLIVHDVTGDGLLDVVTAPAQSEGQPKHISHPRIYVNLGSDGGGNWRGLRFEDARIPQLLADGGQPSSPNFAGVAAGDVTGDGTAELYFCDYDNGPGGGLDLNDRLLVNDGAGVFTDESILRMLPGMLLSASATSCLIEDLNADGLRDIVKDTALSAPQHVSASYNAPSLPGYFAELDLVYTLAPYHVTSGDLNADGRPDLVITDDGVDRCLYNGGNDANGLVQWEPPLPFDFHSGGDDGFGGNNLIADLDGDGWNDVLITDVDFDISGCNRYMHVYRNPGGQQGEAIALVHEEEQPGDSGWKGVSGMSVDDLRGAHDVAVFDLDADGDLDLVLGHCSGTSVWLNEPVPPPTVGTAYCACDGSGAPPPCGNPGAAGAGCANSTGVGAVLIGSGSGSVTTDDLGFSASGLPASQPVLLFAGTNAVNGGDGVIFGDGLRCAGQGVVRLGVQTSDGNGHASWGPGLASQAGFLPGDLRHFQAWYRDPVGGPCANGFNLTQGIELAFGI